MVLLTLCFIVKSIRIKIMHVSLTFDTIERSKRKQVLKTISLNMMEILLEVSGFCIKTVWFKFSKRKH